VRVKILIAIDGSPCSRAMVAEVGRRPWPAGSVMKVVTVDPPLAPGFLRASPGVIDELAKQQRADSHKLLAAAVTTIERSVPGVAVLPQLLEGWPKEAILDEAERWGADLIVVGSHGYGTFKRIFHGSISMTVAMNATCSVLIIRPPAEAHAPTGTPPASNES
jgi:nucleotide-binding universal stress UspA family protein